MVIFPLASACLFWFNFWDLEIKCSLLVCLVHLPKAQLKVIYEGYKHKWCVLKLMSYDSTKKDPTCRWIWKMAVQQQVVNFWSESNPATHLDAVIATVGYQNNVISILSDAWWLVELTQSTATAPDVNQWPTLIVRLVAHAAAYSTTSSTQPSPSQSLNNLPKYFGKGFIKLPPLPMGGGTPK